MSTATTTHDEKVLRRLNLLGPSKGELKKVAIIKAAIQCIATQGYERTNYETIGALIEMKRPHVAYHFPKKQLIVEMAIRYVYGIGVEMVEKTMAARAGKWEGSSKPT